MKTEAATFDDLRRRGNELADAGRYREAIELLTAANRQRRDPRLERKLIRYRRAAPVLETPVGRPDWPPPLADPFPGITGRLPEVSPAELSADLVGGGIQQHHGAVAGGRGLIPSSDARALAATIDRVFTDFDHWADQRDGEGAEASGPEGHFVPFSARRHERREWVRNSGAIWVAALTIGGLRAVRVAQRGAGAGTRPCPLR
ncbi:MAG: hypothetical protein U5R31_05360 [Acidimicrobiia bacterium]|nr:hypothetical protein [Acidimicrobiia bacterium]